MNNVIEIIEGVPSFEYTLPSFTSLDTAYPPYQNLVRLRTNNGYELLRRITNSRDNGETAIFRFRSPYTFELVDLPIVEGYLRHTDDGDILELRVI